jgi:tetratricopeptide (TPR) repeat protein
MTEQEERALFDEALKGFGQADFEGADARLGELVAANPQHAEAWAYLGLCRLETGRHREGLEVLERAAELAPDNADIHYWLGNAAGALGQLDRAAACYRRALEIDPVHVKAGELEVRTRGLLDSREHYRTALHLLEARRAGTAAVADRNLALALRELLHSVAIFADSPARDELPYCAREILKLAHDVHLTVTDPAAFGEWARHCEMGYQGLKLMNFIQAAQAYEQALGYRSQDLFVCHGLALALAASGQVEPAARLWLHVLELDPEFDFTSLTRVHLAATPSTH